jgi:Family of unknown function (DUF6496)
MLLFDGSERKDLMADKHTIERARSDKAHGKAATTPAGEFVREAIHHVRQGKHGARSPQQAIAIGLSKARRSGVDLPPPRTGKTKTKTKRSGAYAYAIGRARSKRGPKASPTRSRATRGALAREETSAASTSALRTQGRRAASERTAADRSHAAKKAVRTKERRARSAAAKKVARTRKSAHHRAT